MHCAQIPIWNPNLVKRASTKPGQYIALQTASQNLRHNFAFGDDHFWLGWFFSGAF